MSYPNPKDYINEDGQMDYEAFDNDVDEYEEHRLEVDEIKGNLDVSSKSQDLGQRSEAVLS